MCWCIWVLFIKEEEEEEEEEKEEEDAAFKKQALYNLPSSI